MAWMDQSAGSGHTHLPWRSSGEGGYYGRTNATAAVAAEVSAARSREIEYADSGSTTTTPTTVSAFSAATTIVRPKPIRPSGGMGGWSTMQRQPPATTTTM